MLRDKLRLLVVATQAGSANALAPVVAFFDARGSSVVVLGFEHAYRAFVQRGVAARQVFAGSEAVEELRTRTPDVLLTDTSVSWASESAELWDTARRLGVPSVALLDHWCNYAERFTPPGWRPFDTTPDVIAVMDAPAQQRLLELGCPPSRVRVTGQPAFDAILGRAWPADGRLRRALDLPENGFVVLFVSEPIGQESGVDDGSPGYLGYTETSVLELVFAAAGIVAEEQAVGIVVRPHPLEGVAFLDRVARRVARVPWRLGLDDDPRPLAAAADAVVGMTSILLLEAALMGRPTASIRPHSRRPFDLVALHPELIQSVDDVPAITAWFRSVMRRQVSTGLPASRFGRATERVAAVALELATVSG